MKIFIVPHKTDVFCHTERENGCKHRVVKRKKKTGSKRVLYRCFSVFPAYFPANYNEEKVCSVQEEG